MQGSQQLSAGLTAQIPEDQERILLMQVLESDLLAVLIHQVKLGHGTANGRGPPLGIGHILPGQLFLLVIERKQPDQGHCEHCVEQNRFVVHPSSHTDHPTSPSSALASVPSTQWDPKMLPSRPGKNPPAL